VYRYSTETLADPAAAHCLFIVHRYSSETLALRRRPRWIKAHSPVFACYTLSIMAKLLSRWNGEPYNGNPES